MRVTLPDALGNFFANCADRVHIRLSVICLQNGAPGQMIRVTGKDRKLVFTAQVIDGNLLKGRL